MIYTYIGEVCVSVNPYRTMNIYDQSYVNKYKGKLTITQIKKIFPGTFSVLIVYSLQWQFFKSSSINKPMKKAMCGLQEKDLSHLIFNKLTDVPLNIPLLLFMVYYLLTISSIKNVISLIKILLFNLGSIRSVYLINPGDYFSIS